VFLFLLAEGLIALKYDVITVNLVISFLTIVTIFLIVWIKKSAELKAINNNFKTVLKQQKELTVETGKINQLLNKESINYQIRLNAYHDKSIEAVNDIYIAIVDLRAVAKVLTFNQGDEEKKKFMHTLSEFKCTFDTRKIWIDSDLSSHIENVAIEIDSRANRFFVANTRAERVERLSEERMNKIFDEQDQFYDYIHQEISIVFDGLVKKISSTVGTDMA
jgi:hypothetical protein